MDEALLIRLYMDQPRSVDALPYTSELDKLVKTYSERTAPSITHREAYLKLQALRKAKKLVRRKG